MLACVMEIAGSVGVDIHDPASEKVLSAVCCALCPVLCDLTQWPQALKQWPGILHMFSLISSGYPGPRSDVALLPRLADVSTKQAQQLLLPAAGRMALASLLPAAERVEWQLLFNSGAHGKSFATFCGRVFDRGSTVLVVRPHQAHPTFILIVPFAASSSCDLITA
jgi:hypothetical protein